MPSIGIPKSEQKWRAEDDARTLAQSEAIRVDTARFKRAQQAAKGMAKEAFVKADAMGKIAEGKKPVSIIKPNKTKGARSGAVRRARG